MRGGFFIAAFGTLVSLLSAAVTNYLCGLVKGLFDGSRVCSRHAVLSVLIPGLDLLMLFLAIEMSGPGRVQLVVDSDCNRVVLSTREQIMVITSPGDCCEVLAVFF